MTHHAQNAPGALTISGVSIHQDEAGRYCLNDLHRAAGGQARHKPGNWLQCKQTIDLIKELEIAGIPAIQSKQRLGTFVHKDMVYDYAMWISAAFKVKVIRAYDALMAQAQAAPKPDPEPEISATLRAALCREAHQLAFRSFPRSGVGTQWWTLQRPEARRWSVAGCIPTLERGNDQTKRTSSTAACSAGRIQRLPGGWRRATTTKCPACTRPRLCRSTPPSARATAGREPTAAR